MPLTFQATIQHQMPLLLAEATRVRERIISAPSRWGVEDLRIAVKRAVEHNMRPRSAYLPRCVNASTDRQQVLNVRVTRRLLGHTIRLIMSNTDINMPNKAGLLLRTSRESRFRDIMSWSEFFDEKFDEYVYTCDDCGHIDLEDNGREPYNGDHNWVCRDCLSDHYSYSNHVDCWVHNDDDNWSEYFPDDDDDNDDDEDDVIGGRHSGKRILRHIPSSFDSRKPQVFLGMELEVEIKDGYSRIRKAEELYEAIQYHQVSDKAHRYIHIEEDGSLSNGFEMVTGWTGLDVHREKLRFFQAPWQGVRSHDTRTCGLHVHVSKADMTMFHGAKLVMFIHDSGNQKLIRAIARRDNASYAQIKNKKSSYSWLRNAKRNHSLSEKLRCLNEERHEALNFHNEKTVEFRLFKGTLRYETQMACLEFAYMSWFFCRDTGVGSLTTDEFIKYVCKPDNRGDTKFLRRYLKEKGFVLPKTAVVKDNPRMSDAPLQPIEEKVED